MERICYYVNCLKPVGKVMFAISPIERAAREGGYCSEDHRMLQKQRADEILRALARDAEELGIYD